MAAPGPPGFVAKTVSSFPRGKLAPAQAGAGIQSRVFDHTFSRIRFGRVSGIGLRENPFGSYFSWWDRHSCLSRFA